MRAEHRHLKWTLMLQLLRGFLCSAWKVDYQQQSVCAVKGSSVVLLCSFTYPQNETVNSVMWGHERCDIYNGPFIYSSENTSTPSRFQYIGDKQQNCSFKIQQVEHNDSGKYVFRFVTLSINGKWTGPDGSTLKIIDLTISVTKPSGNETTKEGDSVNLTCVNSCDGGDLSSAFTWFKNGESINEGPVLYLRNTSFTNSGNYSCSLKAHTGATSGVVHIDVEYGPKNTSVFVTPSVAGDTGSNLTLICSSHANPPVENYTWFKIVHNDATNVGHQPVFLPDDGGQYLCSVANKHGRQNSSVVTLNIKQYRATFSRDILMIATVAVLLIVTTIIAVQRLNKKRMRPPRADHEEDVQNTDYVNWLTRDNNQTQETNQCEGVTAEVVYTTLDFHNKRKSNLEQQKDSQNEDVTYSRVRGDHPLNPSYIEPS